MEIIIGGIKINYKVYGPALQRGRQGKPLLILHGWGSNTERWEKVALGITAAGYEVITVDMPGFGKSDVPPIAWGFDDYLSWLEKFINSQEELSGKFYLLGHSFGGTLSSIYAVKNPSRIEKLFLVASAGIRKSTFKKTILHDIARMCQAFKNVPLYGIARKVFYKYFVGRTDYLTVKESMKDTYLKVIEKDFSGVLKEIRVPTVIIWGEKDNITLVKDAYYMDKIIEHSKLIVIPDSGHDLNIKNSEVLTKEVLNNL